MYADSKLSHISSVPPLMKADGSLAITDPDRCNVFNAYFASVFTKGNGVLPQRNLAIRSTNRFSLHMIKCYVL